MRANQAYYPVATMCRLLGVSASEYYAWRDRPPSARAQADAALTERIQRIHEHSRETCGVPRIHAELVEEGTRVSRKRIARMMRQAGLEGVSRRKRVRTTQRREDARPAPDLVERDFVAEGPDRLWVADITYISTWSGFLYLAVVVDAWSRRVIGWSMANHLPTELVLEALNMGLWQRRPKRVIHHSDQGTLAHRLVGGMPKVVPAGIVDLSRLESPEQRSHPGVLSTRGTRPAPLGAAACKPLHSALSSASSQSGSSVAPAATPVSRRVGAWRPPSSFTNSEAVPLRENGSIEPDRHGIGR